MLSFGKELNKDGKKLYYWSVQYRDSSDQEMKRENKTIIVFLGNVT